MSNGSSPTLGDKLFTKRFSRLLKIGTYKLTDRALKDGVISLRCRFHFLPNFEVNFDFVISIVTRI